MEESKGERVEEVILVLIRPVFCIAAIVKPNGNKVCKNKIK